MATADYARVRSDQKKFWIGVAAVVAVIAAFVVVNRVQAQRADNLRTDQLYCTLSGVGPFDRGPNTGKLCMDLS